MTRVLITGAAGFIGHHLALRLLDEGCAVTGVDAMTPVAAEGLKEAKDGVWRSIEMPPIADALNPILYAIPAQLLAYHTAVAKGTDVDQPRNLAKSVTVE